MGGEEQQEGEGSHRELRRGAAPNPSGAEAFSCSDKAFPRACSHSPSGENGLEPEATHQDRIRTQMGSHPGHFTHEDLMHVLVTPGWL